MPVMKSLLNDVFSFQRHMRQEMMCMTGEKNEVNMLQFHALLMVAHASGMTMKQLADALHVTSPAATSFVDRLVRMGLLKRLSDVKNRKLVRLALTPKGKRVLHQKLLQHRKAMGKIFGALSASDQRQLQRILRTLIHSLESHHG